jgi:hypothetical protein
MIPSFNRPTGNESVSELADMVAQLQKQVEFLMTGNLSSKNVREIGGWLVDDDRFSSADEDVGMSTADTGGDDVRIWAGGTDPENAPSYIRKSGKGKFTGVTIESNAGYPKIVMDPNGQLFAAYTAADKYVGVATDVLGNGPGFIAHSGSVNTGAQYSTSDEYHVKGFQKLVLESGTDVEFLTNGLDGVIVPSWGELTNKATGQSMQSELNGKASVSHNHDSQYGSSLVYNSATKTLKLFAPNGNLLSSADLT